VQGPQFRFALYQPRTLCQSLFLKVVCGVSAEHANDVSSRSPKGPCRWCLGWLKAPSGRPPVTLYQLRSSAHFPKGGVVGPKQGSGTGIAAPMPQNGNISQSLLQTSAEYELSAVTLNQNAELICPYTTLTTSKLAPRPHCHHLQGAELQSAS